MVEGEIGRLGAAALLDLDEGNGPSPPRDQVDLPAGDPSTPRQDSPAPEPQPPGGEVLGASPALLGRLSAQRRSPSSSARA